MELKKFYSDLLGLDCRWEIEEVSYDVSGKEVRIRVCDVKGARFECPSCGCLCAVYDHQPERVWRHLDTMQMQTFLHARVPRIRCEKDQVQTINLPWATKRSQFTMLFENLAIDLLKECSIARACHLLRISWDEADGILHRAVKRGLARKSKRIVERIAIDETSQAKGHKYLTIVSSHEGTVEYVGKGKAASSLEGYFQALSEEQIDGIKTITMDMSEAYISGVRAYVPYAHRKIVFDKFHVMSHLNNAVNQIRQREARQLHSKGRHILKQTRFLWLYNPQNMPQEKKLHFEKLRKVGLKVGKAWSMKELFRHFWTYQRRQEASIFLKRWLYWVSRSKLTPMLKVAKMIRNYETNLLTHCEHQATNAIAESINAKIQQIKRRAKGFRNFQRFTDAIYFHCGGLDLYPL